MKLEEEKIEKILRWVELKGVDIQYDLFDDKKLEKNPLLNSYLKNEY